MPNAVLQHRKNTSRSRLKRVQAPAKLKGASAAVHPVVQAKLRIGAPSDKYEQEAERVADTVMRMSDPLSVVPPRMPQGPVPVRRKCGACSSGGGLCPECAEVETVRRQRMEEDDLEEEENLLQARPRINNPSDRLERKPDRVADPFPRISGPQIQHGLIHSHSCPASRAKRPVFQRSQTGRFWPGKRGPETAPASVHEAVESPGQPLNDSTRAFMESRFDFDFSGVRIHTGEAAARSACDINASAYTVGQDVVFGAGRFAPCTVDGRRLLAHELTHVIQQAGADRLGIMRRKLTPEQKEEDLQSPRLKDDPRLQQAFDESPLLKKNETSEGVKTLQRALRELGYPLPVSFAKSGDADGIFGKETKSQVKQFQRDNELSDDGVVGRETLRALDKKFNPTVTIESVFFGQDRRELLNNKADWTAAGARYTDWSGKPYHIIFDPDEIVGAKSIPISVDAGKKFGALAKVNIQGGIDGRKFNVKASPDGNVPGWNLSGEGVHRNGLDTDWVFLSGDRLPDKITYRNFLVTWWTNTFAGNTRVYISQQKLFVTPGPAHDTSEASGTDKPNVPTFKRLREATKLAAGLSATSADRIVHRILKRYPSYGVCDVPWKPNNYGHTCPVLKSIWEMSDHRPGNFQCITIARYADAVLNVLGVPKAVKNIETRPVVIWANLAHKEEGIVSDYPHPGINIPSIRHPSHPEWPLGLLDGRCGINNYEACVKLEWTPPGRSKAITQFYCGGISNPKEGFPTARAVLDAAFVLAYYASMANNDPQTGFPRGIRKVDVKVYDSRNKCFKEL